MSSGDRFKDQAVDPGQKVSRLSGERELLVRQLQRRFGKLPPLAIQTVTHATHEQLLRMQARVGSARTLDDALSL